MGITADFILLLIGRDRKDEIVHTCITHVIKFSENLHSFKLMFFKIISTLSSQKKEFHSEQKHESHTLIIKQ